MQIRLNTKHSAKRILGSLIAVAVFVAYPARTNAASPQTWTRTTAPAGLSTAWLLTDGRVMAQQTCTNHWWALAPDSSGNYASSTWTQLADTPTNFAPLYYASAVLPDTRLIVMGGEYHAPNCTLGFSTLAYIYTPATNTWAPVTPPTGWNGGDANSIVLQNGTFVVADPLNTNIFALNAATLTWTQLPTPGKLDHNDEEGWTLLPSGKFLTVDAAIRKSSEIYDPVAQKWSFAGSTVVNLSDAFSEEVGPMVLMYNGKVFATGGGLNSGNAVPDSAGHTANYTVSTGTWAAGPDFSSGLDISDGPASLLPNGNVLVVASPDTYGIGSHFYEYNGASLNMVPGTLNAPRNQSYVYRFLLLPNGQVLGTDGSADVEFYTPNPGVVTTAAPNITSVPPYLKKGTTYTLDGTQLTGLSQANAYGDDVQTATNYPVATITNNASHHVQFQKTHDRTYSGVAPGTASSTLFDVGATTETGPSLFTVIANAIPSVTAPVTVCATPMLSNAAASPNSLWPPNHKLVTVTITYDISSACPVTSSLSVTSNEADAKWVIVDAQHVELESSRDGNGDGRIYTITITTTDAVGEITTTTATVVVVHDQGN